ncbi:hypothetical protein MMC25_001371 [Agyrium rufum]|nr:hypothetical protein [Agyrium rufum]
MAYEGAGWGDWKDTSARMPVMTTSKGQELGRFRKMNEAEGDLRTWAGIEKMDEERAVASEENALMRDLTSLGGNYEKLPRRDTTVEVDDFGNDSDNDGSGFGQGATTERSPFQKPKLPFRVARKKLRR